METSKIEKANNILEKIRGKDYVKKHPFTSEEKAEDFLESLAFTLYVFSKNLKQNIKIVIKKILNI